MEHTIRKIISIDKEAEIYKRSLDEQLKNKKDEFKELLLKFNEQSEEELNFKREKITEIKLTEAEKLAERIREERDKEIKRINECYSKVKEDVVKESFREFLAMF